MRSGLIRVSRCNSSLLVGTVAAILSFVLIVALPRAGIDYKNVTIGAEGIYPSKNICSGITIMFLLPAFFYRFAGRWRKLKRVAYIGLHLALIIATLTRAGWGVLILLYLFTAVATLPASPAAD